MQSAADLTPRRKRLILWSLYGIPTAGILNTACSVAFVLLQAPPGSAIRPMGLAMYLVLVAIATGVCGCVLGGAMIARWFRVPVIWVNALAAMALSLTPFWVAQALFYGIASARGLLLD